MLLNQTIYFERENLKNNSRLKMKVAKDAAYESKKKLLRSTEERKLYFINHKIEKTKGFELHHIVPLLLAHSKNEFDILDVWENMLYIDGKTHSIITQTGNKTIKLNFVADDIELTAPAKNVSSVYCKKDENVLYNTSHKKTMSDYNEAILNEV